MKIYYPTERKGVGGGRGRTCCFGADPVGVRVCIASFPDVIF